MIGSTGRNVQAIKSTLSVRKETIYRSFCVAACLRAYKQKDPVLTERNGLSIEQWVEMCEHVLGFTLLCFCCNY